MYLSGLSEDTNRMSAFICGFSSPGRQAAREGGSRNGTNPRILEQGSINEQVSTLSESLLEAFSTTNDKRFRVDAQDRHEIERWLFGRFHAVLREDQQVTSSQGSTQIEVTSRLSELYPLIEERHASLPMDLNNVERDDEDASFDEPGVEELDSSHQLNTRMDNPCDILSGFDEDRIPHR
ncbi:MAG: hypothetical protein ASARMPREDX12_002938 [Alectoria sarmentosa]|nr:MAG: hypothetical protein ASARMPREDX12_002938 [Alectoria sarmentosa]